MKCVIVYFSQTGNTEKIAKAVQSGVKEAAGNCDLLKIKDANPKRLYEYDLIGLGSPVFHEEPLNVADFIEKLWSVGGKHIFLFTTHGTIPEFYFPAVVPKLKKKGMVVIGMRDWYADAFIPWHPEPYPTAGHPDEIDVKEAEQYGREMVDHSRRISAGEKGLLPADPPIPPPLPPTTELGIQDTTDDPSVFKYHKELCKFPKCRLCMDNCPMYSVDLSTTPPTIASRCQPHCTLCTLICPTGAMEIDGFIESVVPHYKNTTKNLALPILDKAEKEGKFRRLVPVDKIGWDSYVYQVYNKHPKWIMGKGRCKPNNKQ